MANLSSHHVFYWFITPEELREIADEMEEFWKTCKPGQDKTSHQVYGKNEILHVLVDQDRVKLAAQSGKEGK